MKYRHRPIIVDAIQLTYNNIKEVKDFCDQKNFHHEGISYPRFWVKTPNGKIEAFAGDYIIKDNIGTFTVMNSELFDDLYEELENEDMYNLLMEFKNFKG